ncbi:hypothetical protein A3K64_02940 [Candidatus Micrarchaeota archaeon RBG_16_36_9]|nr:MAG: hypothetical protein A3K64_02940 [Candidatus Micrarchaeota archaeon RBG_16_36_9]
MEDKDLEIKLEEIKELLKGFIILQSKTANFISTLLAFELGRSYASSKQKAVHDILFSHLQAETNSIKSLVEKYTGEKIDLEILDRQIERVSKEKELARIESERREFQLKQKQYGKGMEEIDYERMPLKQKLKEAREKSKN